MTDFAKLVPGFADPAHDAQLLFRAILDATARPGRIVSLAATPTGPGALSPAATAWLLTLADRDTPVWLAPDFDRPDVRDFLRFHAGSPIAASRADAAFGVLPAGHAHPFDGFAIGSDVYPDRSASLVIEVPDLGGGPTTTWRGPGIDGSTRVAIAGLPEDFWREWSANNALFPCGVDLVFTAGTKLCALPRSIAVEV